MVLITSSDIGAHVVPETTNPPSPVVTLSQPTYEVATGTITVSAPVGEGITYSINGTTYQSTAVFTAVAPGTYSVTARKTDGFTSAPTTATVNAQPTKLAAPVLTVSQPTYEVATGTITVTSPLCQGITYIIN